MTVEEERFLERLNRGPAGLFLGQHHLALGVSQDPLLALIRRKLNVNESTPWRYENLLGSKAASETAGFLDWLDTKSKSLAASEQLSKISQYGWVGVWSSAIDNIWADCFENSWREIQKIFSESYQPPDPRNRKRLHCTFLFGGTSRVEIDERPPLTKLDYLRRRSAGQSLARRIPTVLGPTGTLAIEAYEVGDWFTIEDLIGLVAQMQPGQCHLFSATDELLATPEITELTRQGFLTAHSRSLATVLSEGSQSGIVDLGVPAEAGDLRRIISFRRRATIVPRDLWVALSSTAHLLDESLLGDPTPLSVDASYAAFRNFLGVAEGRPDWDGISREFAFRREFEVELEKRINKTARQRELHERPIILHGATGTGKTTALAATAYRLAKQREYPVLFVDRRSERSSRDIIDRFCHWAEDEGAVASVVVWDGMRDPDFYDDLARFFASRGRRVILVGTTYRLPESPRARRRGLLPAPSQLTEEEVNRLESFLGRFDRNLAQLARLDQRSHASFLAFLYRLLPPSRAAVRRGLVRELEQVERTLVERSATSPDHDYEPGTALGWALLDAGLLPNISERPEVEVAGERFSAVEDLTALVMVPAQFGLAVPLELLLRATGQTGYVGLMRLLEDVDLVRWVEDGAGNFFLTARSGLEAQIIVRSRLGTAAAQTSCSQRLLLEVRGKSNSFTGSSEVDFAVNLVRALGAQGANPQLYLPEYPALADTLRELREDRGVAVPQLMLQEANLLREWSRQSRNEPEERLRALNQAADVLSAALDLLPAGTAVRLRSSLLVERASTLATRANILSTVPGRSAERIHLFQEARNAALSARAEYPESYYPVDVLTWATRDILGSSAMGEEERAEAIVEVLNAFEVIDPLDIDASQVARYHQRRQEFADLVGDVELAEEAFEALAARNSGAGVYLRTKAIADPSKLDEHPSVSDRDKIEKALHYLAQYKDLVSQDAKCLSLQFDLWWILHAGQRPFADERYCLPFSRSEWQCALDMIDRLQRSGQSYREIPLLFLRGLCEFHLGNTSGALETYTEVTSRSDEVRGRRRIVRSYLSSGSDGRPAVYSGTVAWVSEDLRRGEVYVEELRRQVAFLPREFGGRTLTRGINLGDFHIAFNFLGVVADPPAFLRVRQEGR